VSVHARADATVDEREERSEQKELAELLTVLARSTKRNDIRSGGESARTLKHLREARRLTQKDLWKAFGVKGILLKCFMGRGKSVRGKRKGRRLFFMWARTYSFEGRDGNS
jgi:hypothetical protein